MHIRQSDRATAATGQPSLQIFAKVSESTTLLASILVREGVLLIQMSARVKSDKHIECVILGGKGGSSESPEPPPGSAPVYYPELRGVHCLGVQFILMKIGQCKG